MSIGAHRTLCPGFTGTAAMGMMQMGMMGGGMMGGMMGGMIGGGGMMGGGAMMGGGQASVLDFDSDQVEMRMDGTLTTADGFDAAMAGDVARLQGFGGQGGELGGQDGGGGQGDASGNIANPMFTEDEGLGDLDMLDGLDIPDDLTGMGMGMGMDMDGMDMEGMDTQGMDMAMMAMGMNMSDLDDMDALDGLDIPG